MVGFHRSFSVVCRSAREAELMGWTRGEYSYGVNVIDRSTAVQADVRYRLISVMQRISDEVIIEGGVGIGHQFSRRYATRRSFFTETRR